MKNKNKIIGAKPFGNRTVIGILCLVAALAICFGVAPAVNHITEGKIQIVRASHSVDKGQLISDEDIEIVEVGSYHLSQDVLKSKQDVLGKFATTDLFKGDYLTAEKISDEPFSGGNLLEHMPHGKKAVSISIGSFASGFSGKLSKGDIVSVYVYDADEDRAVNPPELQYVKVITSTTAQGVDKEEVTDTSQPTTVTLLVDPVQAEMLVRFEQTGKMHLSLEYRGDKKIADQYLAKQDQYLKGGA